MSDYVEARYALVVLRQARLSSDQLASELVHGLVRDLGIAIHLGGARADALAAIRCLSVSLADHRALHLAEWEVAYRATQNWCQKAT